MATTLYLVRHGETEGSEVKRYKGSIDVPLSEKGITRMKQVGQFLAKTACLKSIYCSPLSRALKSAEIIARPHGLKPIVIQELRERNFGIWEGMSFDEIKDKYPEEFEAWAKNPLKYSPVEGESTIEVRDRVISALKDILVAHNGEKKIAIVAHGGVNRIILCELLGIPLENIFRIEQDFGCINIIEFYDDYPRSFPVIKLLNFTIDEMQRD